MFPIDPPALMSDHVWELIKEARDQELFLRGGAEREERVIDVVTVRPFGDADELLIAGGTEV